MNCMAKKRGIALRTKAIRYEHVATNRLLRTEKRKSQPLFKIKGLGSER